MTDPADIVASRPVAMKTDRGVFDGMLSAPEQPHGLVVLAHAANGQRAMDAGIADSLHRSSFATLHLDLRDADVAVLAEGIAGAVDWARRYPQTRTLPVGVFGASIGGAAVIVAAAQRTDLVQAVVSHGSRPDLADGFLDRLATPTLFIVGALDRGAVELNRQSFERVRGPKELRIVPGAAHSCTDAGVLNQVARHARDWFVDHLYAGSSRFEGPPGSRPKAPATLREAGIDRSG